MQNRAEGKNFVPLNIDKDNCKVVNNVLTKCNDYYNKDLIIPKGVMVLDRFSITSLYSTELIVPMSVEVIRRNAVAYASKITKLYIENPEIYLEVESLVGFLNLKEIYIGGERVDTVVTQKDGEKISVYLEKYVGNDKSYSIDNDIQAIGEKAFLNRSNLESVEIPSSVKTINSNAFKDCVSLKEINIPESVRNIWGWAFENCYGIGELTIPRSVDYLGIEAFKGWRRNQIIRVPSHLKRIKFKQRWRKGCNAKMIYY